jgi:two-component system alkaline phosphatase synthesis response regulator PhoP
MPRKVMIIEDDEELNEILHYNLTRAGYEVLQVWDGNEAKAAIREKKPDLLLMDVMLPGADGWEICRSFADDPALRKIPIIFLTAKSGREDFDLARQFNMAGFFTKPYATPDILRHVEKVLATTNK